MRTDPLRKPTPDSSLSRAFLDHFRLERLNTHFQTRDRDGMERTKLSAEHMTEKIAARFGVAPDVAARALEIIHRRERPRD